MAQTKIEQGLLKFTEATDYLKIPTGTTAQRPGSPANGYIRFNTTINDVEAYNGTEWTRMGIAPPTFSSVDYPGSATALDPAGGEDLVINGTQFNIGITITIGGTTPSSITRNSSTQLTVTTPAKTAGTYDIVFVNTDGGTATATNAVSYNGLPAFTNAAGSLGSVDEDSVVNLSAAATEPDGGAITYAITSGALPTGLSLNASTGAITGTAPSVSADTTSNFTVTATDNENQTASRAYSITVTNIAPSGNFNTVLYTGNSSTQSITGVGFQPDLVWIKDRNNAEQHILNDSTRGASYDLSTDRTNAEANRTTGFLSFDNDGFTLGTDGGGVVNDSTRGPYVAWCFKANGGTTSSNTDGTITSTVQANNTLGFSIVEYTGTGATASVGHGLDQKPDFVVIKHTNDASAWVIFSDATGTFSYSYLNTTAAFTAYSAMSWDSSVLNLNSGGDQNGLNDNHIAYFFTSKEGFSKIGTYTGNGSTTGPIVETGFEPAFLMIKRTDTSGYGFAMWDNKRTPAGQKTLYPYATNAESNYGYINFLSNGFQHTRTNAGINANGGTYIYIAFAADPDTTSPTLADSFNTKVWTGNYSTQTISNYGFKPDLVWIKNRDQADRYVLFDSIRGVTKYISSSRTDSETTDVNTLTSFNNDGFTLGSSGLLNASTISNVGWAWKAGNELPSINTDGNVDSIVNANANAGFSIVKYTGNGTATDNTIGHGLSSAPEMIIIKSLETTYPWVVYHSAYGTGVHLELNSTGATSGSGSIFGYPTNTGVAPTSTVFTVGGSPASNANNVDYIAYCFHSASGFSKIGSYTGNGSTQSITGLGFQPDWVLIKSATTAQHWVIQDSVRGAGNRLYPSTDSAEGSTNDSITSFDSNGFSIGSSTRINDSGQTFIYMAIKIN